MQSRIFTQQKRAIHAITQTYVGPLLGGGGVSTCLQFYVLALSGAVFRFFTISVRFLRFFGFGSVLGFAV